MTGEEWRFCKKCLVRDLDEGELVATIKDYVERLDESIKTPKEQYEERLKACVSCEKLLSGTCVVCGCYVEMRAAVRRNTCPAPKPKW
ncbi:MAG: DUF6171 family protein [Lachnospiraceae bacterium]|nr:DUF6171 family protein [Lachnospiraceae bacterium]